MPGHVCVVNDGPAPIPKNVWWQRCEAEDSRSRPRERTCPAPRTSCFRRASQWFSSTAASGTGVRGISRFRCTTANGGRTRSLPTRNETDAKQPGFADLVGASSRSGSIPSPSQLPRGSGVSPPGDLAEMTKSHRQRPTETLDIHTCDCYLAGAGLLTGRQRA